jgi:KDO2-lipid IV(A) lauroyltransferase
VPDRVPFTFRELTHPRYWTTWLFLGLLRVLALLPYRAGLAVGGLLGTLTWHLLGARRRITDINLQLCFPELTPAQRTQLARATFRSTGIALVEIGWTWWGGAKRLPLRVIGADVLQQALAQGRGVLLLGGHYTPLELSGYHFSTIAPAVALYRPDNNPVMDWMIRRARARFCQPVPRSDLRQVRRALLDNQVVWLAPDQDFGLRNAEFAPFFGHTAATLTMPTRLAKLNGSPVLFIRHQREADGYVLELTPMTGFPGATPKDDAALFNTTLEQAIRQHPEQYLWMHQRFKTQPDGRRKLYRAAAE